MCGKGPEEFQGKNNLQSVKPDELSTNGCRGELGCKIVEVLSREMDPCVESVRAGVSTGSPCGVGEMLSAEFED